VRRHIERQREG
jgi:hypothetical protein